MLSMGVLRIRMHARLAKGWGLWSSEEHTLVSMRMQMGSKYFRMRVRNCLSI